MTTASDFIVQLSVPNAFIPRLRQVQNGIVKGLLAIQLPDGWPDTHLMETRSSTWTSAIILKSLLRQGVVVDNYSAVINKILARQQEKDGHIGWEMDERFSSSISTYVTADILSLLLSLSRFDEAVPVINSLQAIRNNDGGWGVCPKDTLSKVRSTAWVVNSLLDARDYMATRSAVNVQVIENATKWLYGAQNDDQGDYGWGYLPNSSPSSVSCTSGALYALLRIAEQYERIGVRKESLRRSIQTLKNLGSSGFWKGDVEDLGITIDGEFVGRHITGGLGTLSVIVTLLKAIDIGYLSPEDNELFGGIENVITRCKNLPGKDGMFITPSEQGGPPIIWNSAYALEAIYRVQEFYLRVLEGSYIDRKVYDAVYKKVRFWKRLAVALMVAALGVTLAVNARGLTPLLDWFANLPPLVQGVILIIITIVFEEIYHRLIKPLYGKWLQRQKEATKE